METVDFTIEYNNKEIACSAHLYQYGYTFRVEVQVLGQTLVLEPDEEGQFRAITTDINSNSPATSLIEPDLMQAIADLLQEALS